MAAAARKVRTAPALTWPELLPLLQQHFALTTIYDRELDGRVVATRFDPATHTVVDVTDFELAWARKRVPTGTATVMIRLAGTLAMSTISSPSSTDTDDDSRTLSTSS